uniref:CTP synthetase n=1 Tax=Aeromonas veronii TaxID=654 RepID=A0A346FW99_AERVE|nr:CTP synthetase [Aeromonas veronii]
MPKKAAVAQCPNRIYFQLLQITLLILACRLHKTGEQSVAITRSRGELRVELRSHEPGVIRDLDDFHQLLVGGETGHFQTCRFNLRQQLVVDFVTVTVTLVNSRAAVHLTHLGIFDQVAELGTQTHGTAQIGLLGTGLDVALFIHPLGDEADDRIRAIFLEFGGVSPFHTRYVASEFDHGNLHAEADTQVGDLVLAGILGSQNFAFHTALTEATRHQDRVQTFQQLGATGLDILRVDVLDVDGVTGLETTVLERLVDGLVSVRQGDVLADHTDGHFTSRVGLFVDNLFPLGQVSLFALQTETLGEVGVQILGFQQCRDLVDGVDVFHGDDGALGHVAEQSDLGTLVGRNGTIGAADQHIRLDTDGEQLFNGVLGRLGLHFTGSSQVRNQRQVHEHGVVAAHFGSQLTNGFEERQGLDVTYGTAHFDDGNLMAFGTGNHPLFDGVGDVRDNLNGGAQIVTTTLFTQYVGVDAAGGKVVATGHLGADETLVVAQIQIGFGPVLGYEHFTMLGRAHGARIHVDVRVQFHDGHIQTTGFQNGCQRSCGNAFAEG